MDIVHEYEKLYRQFEFERIGLFRCIKNAFRVEVVAYVGASIHIAPSFVFRRVIYIDNSQLATEFYAHENKIIEYIQARKEYRAKPSLKFLNKDYRQIQELKEEYDLVIALYAPDSLTSALKMTKMRGVVVYLPLPSEDRELVQEDVVEIGTIVLSKGKYEYVEGRRRKKASSRRKSQKAVFIENNEYYVLKKMS